MFMVQSVVDSELDPRVSAMPFIDVRRSIALAHLAGHRAGTALIDIVYPKRCASCGERGKWVCEACLARLSLFEESVCAGCGVPKALEICACADMVPGLRQVRSVGPFTGWLRDAIHSFKYHHEWARFEHLGPQLATIVAKMQPLDGLVPVPLHRSRLRDRGFNQSAVLATMVGERLGLPVVSALERTRATVQQTGLSATERQQNVDGAFAVANGIDLGGANLLLIDDVVTTGAVLNACATTLVRGGAASVRAATLARQVSIRPNADVAE